MGLFGRKNSEDNSALLFDVIYVGGLAPWPEPGAKTLMAGLKLELHDREVYEQTRFQLGQRIENFIQ